MIHENGEDRERERRGSFAPRSTALSQFLIHRKSTAMANIVETCRRRERWDLRTGTYRGFLFHLFPSFFFLPLLPFSRFRLIIVHSAANWSRRQIFLANISKSFVLLGKINIESGEGGNDQLLFDAKHAERNSSSFLFLHFSNHFERCGCILSRNIFKVLEYWKGSLKKEYRILLMKVKVLPRYVKNNLINFIFYKNIVNHWLYYVL